MRIQNVSLLLLISIGVTTVNAFTVVTKQQQQSSSTRATVVLHSTAATTATTTDHVTKAGCGIQPTSIAYGNCNLFDPNKEGKVGNTQERILGGSEYSNTVATTTKVPTPQSQDASSVPSNLQDAQHWLEDIGLPQHFAKPSNPVTAKVLGRTRVIGDDAPGDIQHILLELPEGMHYVEGQSLSVIPPPTASGKKEKPRLYSIASTRYGDLLDGKTVSLCVRRAVYYDPVTGLEDPSKKGICSNYLCDLQRGDTVQVAGPVGKTMLLPNDLSKDIIMVATGTGIAPFRAFLHRLFVENTVDRHVFTGQAWLILGVPTTSGLLYPEELNAMQQQQQSAKLRIDTAISREMVNDQGGKLYVQDVLAQEADTLLQKLEDGATIYFCGLKGMMPGILEALETVCEQKGLNFAEKQKEWKDNHQWHVEVY